jgi:DNA-binding response OmpR family regulator
MPDTLLVGTVLAEEDDPLLKATFRASGLRVLAAATGTQALDLARAERPDVGLPRMNGQQICQALETDPESAATRMVMLTPRRGPADQGLAAQAGTDAYLPKPLSPAQLLDAVCPLLRTERAT